MKYSKKGLEKRKKDREGFAEFFIKCIERIKTERLCCTECGAPLKGNVSEIAHVLPKSYFKSIATNDLNWIPLCGMYSENQCHLKFDDSKLEIIKKMTIFPKICCIFAQLEDVITEKIPYKIYDRYQNSTEEVK